MVAGAGTLATVTRVPAAGTHGGDGPAVARALGIDPADLLDLSQNLNPFAPAVDKVVRRHLDALRQYPDDRDATTLLAAVLEIPVERVLLTNGGSEAIRIVAAELGGGVRSEPEFALHPRDAHLGERSGPRWRSNPHSPTGWLARPDDRAEVWDEAFYALATGCWSAQPDGVVVGSLTKTFACPGLRLGYVLAADDEQRARFARHQPHWSVSALSLACLPEMLDSADLAGWSTKIARARRDLVTLLTQHGLLVHAADAPWVLVESSNLRDRLAPLGVLVRDCASFGFPGLARIAVPDDDGLARLAETIDRLG